MLIIVNFYKRIQELFVWFFKPFVCFRLFQNNIVKKAKEKCKGNGTDGPKQSLGLISTFLEHLK